MLLGAQKTKEKNKNKNKNNHYALLLICSASWMPNSKQSLLIMRMQLHHRFVEAGRWRTLLFNFIFEVVS